MRHSHSMVTFGVAALGLLATLPACAEDRTDPPPDQQIIGAPPTVGCCWGYMPGAAVSRELSAVPPSLEDWHPSVHQD